MAEGGLNRFGGSRMLAVYAGAELTYQMASFNLSSPQTAELNAKARAPTIGKWVNLASAKALGWMALLCLLDKSLWPALGGGLAFADMYLSYKHAIASGLASSAPGTESY
jgi:hypothetical protein